MEELGNVAECGAAFVHLTVGALHRGRSVVRPWSVAHHEEVCAGCISVCHDVLAVEGGVEGRVLYECQQRGSVDSANCKTGQSALTAVNKLLHAWFRYGTLLV